MSDLRLTPEEYVTEIIMSKDFFLLLEGSDDEKFFTLIYNTLRKNYPHISSELKKITIETAEQIKGSLGNRAKIEEICNLIAQEKLNVKKRVLGFVDREFREFEYETFLDDKIKDHKINDRLIWSRGHSIENYFFEVDTFREAFNNYLVSRWYPEAFEIFESKFDDIIKIVCSLSLAGLSENLLMPISKTLDWKCIDITSTSIHINLTEWQKTLRQKIKLDQIRIDNLIKKFETYLNIINKDDVKVAKWLCHGHIGFEFMFAVYGKCLYTATLSDISKNPDQEADKVNKNKDTRFPVVANAWIANKSKKMLHNQTQDFPIKCFFLLIGYLEQNQ